MKNRLVASIPGLLCVLSTVLIAVWYRNDSVFSGQQPWTVEWFGTWFIGLFGGAAITGLAAMAILGIACWIEWLVRGK